MFSVAPDFPLLGDEAFTGWTLVVGIPSVGHVGQLSADLILENCKLEKAGRIFDDAVEPMVAVSKTDGRTSLMTSAEFYAGDNKVALLHLRAPVIKRHSKAFVEKLLEWSDKYKFGKIALISGVFASERIDVQLQDNPGIESYRFVATPNVSEDLLKTMTGSGWKRLEKRQFESDVSDTSGGEGGVVHIPGSGFTQTLLEESEKRKTPCVAFLMFASDGVPVSQVIPFYSAIDAALGLTGEGGSRKGGVDVPEEWEAAVGGGRSDTLIY